MAVACHVGDALDHRTSNLFTLVIHGCCRLLLVGVLLLILSLHDLALAFALDVLGLLTLHSADLHGRDTACSFLALPLVR